MLMTSDAAGQLLDRAVAEDRIPGAVLAAGLGGPEPLLLHVVGDAQRDDQGHRPMAADTIFDLASLTKVVATLPCLLSLVASGELGLDDPVRRYLPAFDGDGKDAVTARHLLTHTSGLPPHRKYYEEVGQAGEALAAALAEPLVAAPGSVFEYSDVGMIVAGELAATIASTGLDELTLDVVARPLAMADTGYRPAARLLGRIAATEPADGPAAGSTEWTSMQAAAGGSGGSPSQEAAAGRPHGSAPQKAAAKVGVVHDENAELLGGVAGHAGLFGTAADLARYAAAWAGSPGTAEAGWAQVPASLRADALRCQTDGLGGRRGLAWGLRHDRWDNMGDGWPESGAGHTGFTGTSLSVDPVSGLWAVLLTNAVHFGRGPEHSVVTLRKQVHRAVAAALLDSTVQ